MAESPRTVLTRALAAAAGSGPADLSELFTDDVVGWSPNLSVGSRAELESEFAERDEALSNVMVSVDAFYLVGDHAIAEWRLSADHTGSLSIGDMLVDPSGRTAHLAGATFAQFRADRICAFRHYFDDAALLEQILFAE